MTNRWLRYFALSLAMLCLSCSKPTPSEAFTSMLAGDVAKLEQLLDAGLDADSVPDPERPDVKLLHYASMMSSPEAITVLVKAGADIDAQTDLSVTPLLGAAMYGKTQNGLTLIGLGADVHATNMAGATPLHLAVAVDDIELSRALLGAGANANARTKLHGGTALSIAANEDSTELAKLLLENGADPSIANEAGQIPLDFAKSEEMKRVLSEANRS